MLVQIETCLLDPATGREGEWVPAGPPESVTPTGSPRKTANLAAEGHLTQIIAHDRTFYGRVRARLLDDDGMTPVLRPDTDGFMVPTYSGELMWDTPSLDLPHEVDGLPLHIERWSRSADVDPGDGQWIQVSRTTTHYNSLDDSGYELHTTVALCGWGETHGRPQAETLFSVTAWGAHPTVDDVVRMARTAIAGHARYGSGLDVPIEAYDMMFVRLAPAPVRSS